MSSESLEKKIEIEQSNLDSCRKDIKSKEEELDQLRTSLTDFAMKHPEAKPGDPAYETMEETKRDIRALEKDVKSLQGYEAGYLARLSELQKLKAKKDAIEDYDEVEAAPPILVPKEVVKTISESSQQLDKLYEINLYVYIAGVYIPVLGVNISSTFASIPTATIDVPPDPVFLGIGREDRIPVQIFIKDTFSNICDNDDIPGLMSLKKGIKPDYDKYIATNKIFNNRLLIFTGEIVSYSYSSTPSGRYITLQCESEITFMNDIKIESTSTVDPLLQQHGEGSSNGTYLNIQSSDLLPAALFITGLTVKAKDKNGVPLKHVEAPTPPSDTPAVETPAVSGQEMRVPGDFIDNLMTFLQAGDFQEKSALTAYYTKHSKELQLNNRYIKVPYFDNLETFGSTGFPILGALKELKTLETINRISDFNPTNTVFDYVNYLASNMEYDFSIQCSPTLVQPQGKPPRLGQIIFKPMLYEALPPACNVIQKEHILQVNFNEQVRGLPTRVIGQSANGIARSIHITDSTVGRSLMNMIYPPPLVDEIDMGATTQSYTPQDYTTPELMNNSIVNEEFTGPHVQKFVLPGWLDFISTEDKISYAASEDKVNWAKHFWIMSRAEYKTANVNMVFNPFLVVGAPVVILDADVFDGFSLVGYAISIHHTINKNNATTQVVLNFPRTLEDEKDDDKRLENTYTNINKLVTHVKARMDNLYTYIYGCKAYDYLKDNSFKFNENNPRKAYKNNYRKVCTLEQFYDFLATDADTSSYTDWRSSASKTELHREIIYKSIKLDSLQKRRDPDLVKNLLKLQERLLASDIYT